MVANLSLSTSSWDTTLWSLVFLRLGIALGARPCSFLRVFTAMFTWMFLLGLRSSATFSPNAFLVAFWLEEQKLKHSPINRLRYHWQVTVRISPLNSFGTISFFKHCKDGLCAMHSGGTVLVVWDTMPDSVCIFRSWLLLSRRVLLAPAASQGLGMWAILFFSPGTEMWMVDSFLASCWWRTLASSRLTPSEPAAPSGSTPPGWWEPVTWRQGLQGWGWVGCT